MLFAIACVYFHDLVNHYRFFRVGRALSWILGFAGLDIRFYFDHFAVFSEDHIEGNEAVEHPEFHFSWWREKKDHSRIIIEGGSKHEASLNLRIGISYFQLDRVVTDFRNWHLGLRRTGAHSRHHDNRGSGKANQNSRKNSQFYIHHILLNGVFR